MAKDNENDTKTSSPATGNSEPKIWKVNHGKGSGLTDEEKKALKEKNLVVACYKEDGNQGGKKAFKDNINEGDFFYLTYTGDVQLLGRFVGKGQPYPEKDGWFEREYTVIAEAKEMTYGREEEKNKKGWEPGFMNTCYCVEDHRKEEDVEKWILQPYFEMSLADLRSKFGECGYWWLNADDGIKDFSEIPLGGTEDINLLNNDGNERLKQSNFLDAKAGDVVVVYQSQKIIALCEISKSVNKDDPKDKQNIQIRKWKALGSPISIDELKELENLGNEEPFQKAPSDQDPFAVKRGTLFRLTKNGFDPIMDLIHKKNLPHTSPDVPSPTPVVPNDDKKPKYWWLNITSSIDGPKITLSAPEEKKFLKAFREANVGDTVYLSNHTYSLVAICKIDEKQSDGKIQIVDEKTLARDIPHSDIERSNGEKEIKLPTSQGMLCALTEEQVSRIKGVIKKKLTEDSQSTTSVIDPEQKKKLIEEFLSEVYLGKTKKEGEEKYAMLESLLETKKNIILQGPPGVGKTFAATRLAYSLLGLGLQELKEHGNKDPRIQFVQFHQSYSYEDFVMGYKPTGDGFKLQEGIFYKFCKEAQKKEEAYKENPKDTGNWYFLIIDEINRGNTSRIFGELLMLIENGYRGKKHAITLAYEDKAEQDSSEKEDKRFYVPENLFIIGMMNTADRSLAMLDYALRRRFAFFDMRPAFDSDRFEEYQKGLSNTDFGKLIDAVKTLNEKIADDKSLGQGFCIGHSYFCNWKECTERKMRNAVWYDILPLLREYYFDNQTKYAERLEPLSSTGLLPEEDKEKFDAWYAKQKPNNGQAATPVATTPPATPVAPTNQVTSA